MGHLIKVFLRHGGPLPLVASLGASGLFIGLLPGFSGEAPVPIADDPVKGKFKRALRGLTAFPYHRGIGSRPFRVKAPSIKLPIAIPVHFDMSPIGTTSARREGLKRKVKPP